MNILMGISGKPRAGKDSIGDYLHEEHGFYIYAFADYLKWVAYTHFGFDKEELWGRKSKETRKFLQNLGTFLTTIDTYFFVDKVVEKIKNDYKYCMENDLPYKAVITDVRREDELKIFDRASSRFVVWGNISSNGVSLENAFDKLFITLVSRDVEKTLKEEDGLAEAMKHPVEGLPDADIDWDLMIDNNGTIEDLHHKIDSMLADVGVV